MATFIIEGGHTLNGEITPQGAKNEALEVICATLLTNEPVTIKNLPNILDVNNLISLMEQMGVGVRCMGTHTWTFQASDLNMSYLQSDEFISRCASLRGSVLLLGPLLGRFHQASIARPGGDKIGRRRLDTHFQGISELGAQFTYNQQRGIYDIYADHLQQFFDPFDLFRFTETLIYFDGFGNDIFDEPARVQRPVRVLKYDLDILLESAVSLLSGMIIRAQPYLELNAG